MNNTNKTIYYDNYINIIWYKKLNKIKQFINKNQKLPSCKLINIK
jgi:hypothetical protein